MNRKSKVYKMTTAALLCAIGIIIPLISPIRIVLEPASYTLASHVPIFIAMFISPATAVVVAIGTTAGFFISGFPIVVVLRAATHTIWAFLGAKVLEKREDLMDTVPKRLLFSFFVGLTHAVLEMMVVIPFYFGASMSKAYYAKGFFVSVVLLVGLGTVVHSMFDFFLSRLIWSPVNKTLSLKKDKRELTSLVK
ncbi:MAG: hypothetical protein WBI17_03055 [Clostridiaceae bacterium]